MHKTLDPRTHPLFEQLLRRKSVQQFLPQLREHHPDTYDHSLRVAELSMDLALENGLPVQDAIQIGYAGLVHDFGKTFVSRDVLDKAGPLAPEELEEARQHPRIGFEALRKKAPETVRRLAVAHHEHIAGGYPRANHPERRQGVRPRLTERRTKQPQLRLWSQIVAAADLYDALASRRSYKAELDIATIKEVMRTKFKGSRSLVGQLLKRHLPPNKLN